MGKLNQSEVKTQFGNFAPFKVKKHILCLMLTSAGFIDLYAVYGLSVWSQAALTNM